MQQRSFGSVEYEHKKVKTRRQTFLERMDRLVPWAELEQRIAPDLLGWEPPLYVIRDEASPSIS